MSKIKKLDKETINLISAGEVIERPADVLKELLENSIDSNADNIKISIKKSGIQSIEVVDNGEGIDQEDLKKCVKKYTTSKIKKIDDLYSINSFGFRGEALSTIDAVSNLQIISSTDNSGQAYLLDQNKNIKKTTFTKGTKIKVENLFYNLPVRKKFLKSKSSEYSKLYNVFIDYVILYPNIKFKFVSEKKKEIYPKTNRKKRYQQVFGRSILDKTIDIDINNPLFKVKGIIGKPISYFYYSKNFTYINNRSVKFTDVKKILKEVYDDYLMIQQKPFFVLFFEFNTKTIDINVHPKKKIVKLENEILVLKELKKELKQIFSKHNIKEKVDNTKIKQKKFVFEKNTDFVKSNKLKSTPASQPIYNMEKKNASQNQTNDLNITRQKYFNKKEFSNKFPINFSRHKIVRILGQIHRTFILCECENGFLLIDQHAAAERINLEKNRSSLFLERQRLLNSKKLDFINLEQKEFILNNKELLKNIGFVFKKEKDYLYLQTIPVVLGRNINSKFFTSIIDDLKTDPKENFKPVLNRIVKQKSCKESIKSNEELTYPQQIKLIKDLNKCKHKTICAHGRPTIIFFSLKDLDKLFKRIV